MKLIPKITLGTLLLLFTGEFLAAQVQVQVAIKRRLFIVHEPIIATMSIRNLSGRDLELGDESGQPWFGFEISRMPGNTGVSPINPNYRVPPLIIPNGKTVSRNINIREIYKMQEFGIYNVKAFVILPGTQRVISSRPVQVDVTEGKVIYKQTVGIPPDSGRRGNSRAVTLLSHTLPKGDRLYARVVDPDYGTIYCTHNLGRLLSFDTPKVAFDGNNEIHILHAIAPKSFRYIHLGLDGEIVHRETYHAIQGRPRITRLADGSVQISGGIAESDVGAQQVTGGNPAIHPPKISDRPAGIPQP